MPRQSAGARRKAGIFAFKGRHGGGAVNRAGSVRSSRPIGFWAFTGVAIASFGGPLALAALNVPGLVADAGDSAGLAAIASVVVFAIPLLIWLRYAQHVNSSGGLFAFVEAAAGRRVALVQAAVWIFSYLLYVLYTTVQIVYDLLPDVIPGERHYQTLLALLIPIAIASVMIAGRATALLVIGLMAAGQVVLGGILDGVTLAHVSTPVSTFGTSAPLGSLTKATAQTSLLYVCGSLPLFLGGELAQPARTMARGLCAAFALTGIVVVLAVAPLAASPGLLNTEVPGVNLVQQFAGRGLAQAIGIGVGVSIAGVILCEYLALTRLISAISAWRMRPITIGIGALLVLIAPFTLIDPEGFYNTLAQPSLIALWVSQLIVFLVFPFFARKHNQRALPAWTLAVAASALAVYGLWTGLQGGGS